MRRDWAVAMALTCVSAGASLAACAPDAYEACFDVEERGYPAVEKFARDAMTDAPSARWSRRGACEDTGKPDAGFAATFGQWKMRQARQYLEGRGWVFAHGVGLLPDNRYKVYVDRFKFGDEPWQTQVTFVKNHS